MSVVETHACTATLFMSTSSLSSPGERVLRSGGLLAARSYGRADGDASLVSCMVRSLRPPLDSGASCNDPRLQLQRRP
ncbi:MAG: hypothetical protein ABIQ33_02790, partial [Caldimonas sp.]